MQIQKIEIRNFKGLKEIDAENLDKVIQICGQNTAGKTSFAQAVKFAFEGTARDRHFLREGAKEGHVLLAFKRDDFEVSIRRQLPTGQCELSIDGQKQKDTAIIRRFVGLNSFNPERFLDPKMRAKAFSSIVQKPFEWHDKELNEFRDNKKCKDYLDIVETKGPGIIVLNKVKQALENYRVSIYREKHSNEGHAKELTDDLTAKRMSFIKSGVDVDNMPTLAQLKLKQEKIEEARKNKQRNEFYIEDNNQLLKNIDKKMEGTKDKIAELTVQLEKLILQKKASQEKLEALKKEVHQVDDDTEIRRLITLREDYELIQPLENKAKESEKKVKELSEEYSKINGFLQNKFDALYSYYSKEITDKIPEVSFDKGEWLFEGKKISSLSSSEAMRLGLRIISLDAKNSIVVVDNSELFDPETAKALSLSNEGASYILTKVGDPHDIEGSKIHIEKSSGVYTDNQTLGF